MTVLRNVTIAYNFDHKEATDPAFDYISDLLLTALSEDCGLVVNSEEVHVNSTTQLHSESLEYTSLRDLYSQPESNPTPPAYTPMRSLVENAAPQTNSYARYTS